MSTKVREDLQGILCTIILLATLILTNIAIGGLPA